jgi:protease YdgD
LSAAAGCTGQTHGRTTGVVFGKDDRVKTDPDSGLWQAVGQLETKSHLVCTATLVAEDVVVTAGHCFINKHGRFDPAISFTVGLAGNEFSEQSTIREVQVDKAFLAGLEHRPDGTYIPKKIAGRDFAFVRSASRWAAAVA